MSTIHDANKQEPKFFTLDKNNTELPHFTQSFKKYPSIIHLPNKEIVEHLKSNYENKDDKAMSYGFFDRNTVIVLQNIKSFFLPKLSEYGNIQINIPLIEEYTNLFLECGVNWKNFLLNFHYVFTDKMPDFIDMNIDDVSMKGKLFYKDMMPVNEIDITQNMEKHQNVYNMIVVKKTEQYGLSAFLSINIQQVSFLKDHFRNVYPTYEEFNNPTIKKIVGENKYLVTDFAFITNSGIKEMNYNYKLFVEIMIKNKQLETDLSDEEKHEIIGELVELIKTFDSQHMTFEKLDLYMKKSKVHYYSGVEISPNTLQVSYRKFNERFESDPLSKVSDYIEEGIFWKSPKEHIVGKKEIDMNGKPSISKSKKSRNDFYLKKLVFDETQIEVRVRPKAPSYKPFNAPQVNDPQVKDPQVKEPEPETNEDIEDVIDSDNENVID